MPTEQAPRRVRLRAWAVRTSKKTVLGLVVAVALLFVVRATVAEAFYVPTSSMTPEIQPGTRVLVWKLAGDFRTGDIIVYHDAQGTALLGRVIDQDDRSLIVARNPEPRLTVPRQDVVGRVVLNTR